MMGAHRPAYRPSDARASANRTSLVRFISSQFPKAKIHTYTVDEVVLGRSGGRPVD